MNNQWTTSPWKKAYLDVMQSHPLHVPEYAAHIQVCIYMILQVHKPSLSLTQPISKTELLMKVVYRVITGLLHSVWIAKRNFWLQKTKFAYLCKIYTCVYNFFIHNHVHTTDSVRPQQWPHTLSNKLQAFCENLQVFYENWDTCSWLMLQPSCKVILLTATCTR